MDGRPPGIGVGARRHFIDATRRGIAFVGRQGPLAGSCESSAFCDRGMRRPNATLHASTTNTGTPATSGSGLPSTHSALRSPRLSSSSSANPSSHDARSYSLDETPPILAFGQHERRLLEQVDVFVTGSLALTHMGDVR
jgi:hypothetical protein